MVVTIKQKWLLRMIRCYTAVEVCQYEEYQGLFQLRGKYGSEEAVQLVDELFSVMDKKTKQLASNIEGSKANEHVPNWAFIVIIVSILLSAVAIYIGTCINKRRSWR